MTPTQTMRLGDYLTDLAQAREERADALQEEKDAYINRRAEELHEQRTAKMSNEDFTIALERLTTIAGLMQIMQQKIEEADALLAFYLQGALKAALYYDCLSIAMTEANAMFSEPPSRERH